MRRLAATVLLAWVIAPAAQAQTAPTLTPDLAFAPPTGIGRGDFLAGTITDIPAAVAVDGGRIYTVGRTQGGTGGADIGIMARRADGALDSGFSDDGKLIVSLAAGTESDFATGIVVLPDHRIRVLGSTDVVAGTTESLDVVIVGLNPDGSPDLAFGDPTTGRVIFPAGPNSDVPARIIAGPDGRLGIVGSRSNGSRDDLFVALREADGSPVAAFGDAGVRVLDRGGTVGGVSMVDRGIDVEFRHGGLLALVLVETDPSSAFGYQPVLHAFDATGADDPSFSDDADLVLAVGEPDSVPGGLAAYGDRFYVTGSTHAGADTDAFLARVDDNGGSFENRTFDMHGRVAPAGQPVVSRTLDLTLVPGLSPTLVAVGSIDWASDAGSTATDWSAAAFNRLDGPLTDAGFGDVVLQAPGQGGLLSAAAGVDGSIAVAGTHVDTSTADTSFGNARLLLDADKRCDLALSVAEPAEITFRDTAAATLTATISNAGTRACSGALGASPPYRLADNRSGVLVPGAKSTLVLRLEHTGARRAEDFLKVSLAAADDVDLSNNDALVHVVFRYCDLVVGALTKGGLIPSEGMRSFPVSLRNAGTSACRVQIGSRASYVLGSGKRAADRIAAAAPAGARPGQHVSVALRATATGDVQPANNARTVSPMVVGVGDSDVRRRGATGFSGRATAGRGPKLKLAALRVSRVEIALLRHGARRCAWLTSARGGFGSRRTAASGDCGAPRWLRARGSTRWRFALGTKLGPGRYTVYSRAVIGAGFGEARFSRGDGNIADFRVGAEARG